MGKYNFLDFFTCYFTQVYFIKCTFIVYTNLIFIKASSRLPISYSKTRVQLCPFLLYLAIEIPENYKSSDQYYKLTK